MLTLLWDIDGTLIRSHGAGVRAIHSVISDRYGVFEFPEVRLHGQTDCGIWCELFRKLSLPIPADWSPLIAEYCEHLEANLESSGGVRLPGVIDLLDSLRADDDVAMGLLTGNAETAAWIKLRRFGLDGFLENFGGFGDWHSDRCEVARVAIRSARQFVGNRFRADRVWVIGDTVNDVRCARSIDAKVIAVATGGDDINTLEATGADVCVHDFSDKAAILAALSHSAAS